MIYPKANTKYGSIYCDRQDIYVSKALLQTGSFCDNELELLKGLINPGDTVLDVGSNLGYHLLAFSDFVGPSGKVLGFDCNPDVIPLLSQTLRDNQKNNIEFYRAAVLNKNTIVDLPWPESCDEKNLGGYSILVDNNEPPASQIRALAIDSLNLSACHLIKADVEGAEFEVLKGAEQTIRKFRPALYIECPEDADLRVEIAHFIKSLGYRLYVHKGIFKVDGQLHGCDNYLGVPEEKPFVHYGLVSATQMLNQVGNQLLKSGLNKFDEAELNEAKEELTKAVKFIPNSPTANLYKGLILMLRGEYSEAAKHYKARFDVYKEQAGTDRRPAKNIPNLDDDDFLSKAYGKRILIYNLQGLGDFIMMSRYFNRLVNYVSPIRLDIATPPELIRLYKERFNVGDKPIHFIDSTNLPPSSTEWDIKIEVNSLPFLFEDTPKKVALDSQASFLLGSPFKTKYCIRKSEIQLIGITYTGSPSHPRQDKRSVPIEHIRDLIKFSPKNVKFVSLQKDNKYLKELGFPEDKLETSLIDQCKDMLDTLELMETLDGVVTVDTSIVHLASTFCIPAFLMLSTPCDWRWGEPGFSKGINPWYAGGNLTLVTQLMPGYWGNVMNSASSWIDNL